MSRLEFSKSVRMFRKFSEETLRRRGGGQMSREGVIALQALEATLRGEQRLSGDLLEPLSAFTSLLQSGQLPPEFGHFTLADALLAIEEASAEAGETAEQRWEFAPELSDPVAARLFELGLRPLDFPVPASNDATRALEAHVEQCRAAILDAAQRASPGAAVVVGAGQAPGLPLGELAARFQRLTLCDVSVPELEERVRAEVPESLRARVSVERYDITGAYEHFVREVDERVRSAKSREDAEQRLVELCASYDVGSGSAGLCSVEGPADFACSSMVLSGLGRGFWLHASGRLKERWGAAELSTPLSEELTLLACVLQQHHVQALLRRSKLAVLISGVAERFADDDGADEDDGPHELLCVERLQERLPRRTEVLAETSWVWSREPADGDEASSLFVEAVVIRKGR